MTGRVFFAAAHVTCEADDRSRLDWDATLAYRRYLWSSGLGVAEAMDTAQRGMGLDWDAAQELIRRSAREASIVGGRIACGAGTDQLPPGAARLEEIERAYLEQCAFVEEQGAQVVLMASRALAASASTSDEYVRVYSRVLERVARPVILHWLGHVFDPNLAGYWGSRDLTAAAETVLALIATHVDKVDGIKVSLLNPAREIALRRSLPPGVRLYSGDDFNYVDLILGGSDALLGIFDAIAPAAGAALAALEKSNIARFRELLEPTVPLARHVFSPPTYHYKTGIVFLAYLNGHQDHFRMLDGLETARTRDYLRETFALADRAGILIDHERAQWRMENVLGGGVAAV